MYMSDEMRAGVARTQALANCVPMWADLHSHREANAWGLRLQLHKQDSLGNVSATWRVQYVLASGPSDSAALLLCVTGASGIASAMYRIPDPAAQGAPCGYRDVFKIIGRMPIAEFAARCTASPCGPGFVSWDAEQLRISFPDELQRRLGNDAAMTALKNAGLADWEDYIWTKADWQLWLHDEAPVALGAESRWADWAPALGVRCHQDCVTHHVGIQLRLYPGEQEL